MRGIRQYSSILAGIVFLVGGTVWAQQATNGRPVVRRYTDRIQLHETPSDLKIPEEMSTPSDRQQPIPEEKKAFVPLMPGVSGGALPYVPPPPVVSPGKEKKGGNWILPPTPEDIEKEKGSESDPSGWGWLADDVKDRQDRIDREVQKKAEEEDPGLTGVLPSNVRKGDTGLMIDNTYKPVASYELMQDMKRTDPQDMVLDTRAGSGRDAAMKSADAAATRAEPRYKPETVSEESKGVADQWWGADRVIDRNKDTSADLSQTREAMAESINLGRTARGSSQPIRPSLSQFQTTSESEWSGQAGSSRSMFGTLSGVNPTFGSEGSKGKQPYSLSTDYDPFSMTKTKQSLSGEVKPLQPLQPIKPMGAMQPYDDSFEGDSGF